MDEAGTWYGGRPQPRRLCVRWGLNPLPQNEAEPPPQFSAHFYYDQTAGCINMPLGTDVGLSPGDFVLDGDAVPSPKRGRSPQIFGPCLLWLNSWMDQDATWHEGRPQPRRLCVRWGPSRPPHKRGGAPSPICGPFLLWPNGWMHQDAIWYGGRPQSRRLWVRWRPNPPPKREAEVGAEPPIFGPWLLWPNGWMDQDCTWHGGRPWSSPHCAARWGHRSAPQNWAQSPPNFRPIFIVAKRLDASSCHLVRR